MEVQFSEFAEAGIIKDFPEKEKQISLMMGIKHHMYTDNALRRSIPVLISENNFVYAFALNPVRIMWKQETPELRKVWNVRKLKNAV